jgi:hypothetical protein
MRTLYRIVRSNPPTLADFVSNVGMGRPLPQDPEAARLWSGISVNETEAQARRRARGLSNLGDYLAELRLEEGPFIRAERTTRSRGHYTTVWADPALLLSRVVRVLPTDVTSLRELT